MLGIVEGYPWIGLGEVMCMEGRIFVDVSRECMIPLKFWHLESAWYFGKG